MPARVLIIEDNRANMELMVYLLGAYGYLASSEFDGEAGIEAARRTSPHLIVCDVHMPKMDGFRLVELIRQARAGAGHNHDVDLRGPARRCSALP